MRFFYLFANSLSLEYHPKSLKGHSSPPIRYLQCPAAVTIRHLQRFLSSKYNLNIDLPNVDIQIIYEDEVLPMGFNLMDVAYCYNWKRVSLYLCLHEFILKNKLGFIKELDVIDP